MLWPLKAAEHKGSLGSKMMGICTNTASDIGEDRPGSLQIRRVGDFESMLMAIDDGCANAQRFQESSFVGEVSFGLVKTFTKRLYSKTLRGLNHSQLASIESVVNPVFRYLFDCVCRVYCRNNALGIPECYQHSFKNFFWGKSSSRVMNQHVFGGYLRHAIGNRVLPGFSADNNFEVIEKL